MTFVRTIVIGALLPCTLLPVLAGRAQSADSASYSDVLPILSDKCFRCHGPDANAREAELRLDAYDSATRDLGGYAAIVPHDVEDSELVRRILAPDVDLRMPPAGSNLSLTGGEKQRLQDWIAAGAAYQDHWALVPPKRPLLSAVELARNPIDAFIQVRLKKEELDFSPEAGPQTLVRRVTLDLTGLPPTIAETRAFVREYAARGEPAYQELIDRLLASPRYGEAMALPWLEAARYADTDGYQYDGPRQQWRWRDWVIDAYNAHMPFDQFTIEQLAGDLLPDPTVEQIIATGFNRNHRYNSELGIVVEEYLLENAVDRVDTTSTVWMGLTMGCARCHDHKYDPFTQRDYYQLIAFFNSVPESGRAMKQGNSEPMALAPTKKQQAHLQRLEEELLCAQREAVPGEDEVSGDLLVDRDLVHSYPLSKESKPPSMKTTGEPKFDVEALHLDGSSTVDLVGLDKKLSYRANQSFTVAFWLRPDAVTDSVILSRQNPSSVRPGIEIAIVDNGSIQFDLITTWVGGAGRATTKAKLSPGHWRHVAITNDGSQSANGQLIYLDGVRAETIVTHNSNSNPGGVNENRPLTLGDGVRPGSRKLRGAVRDLRLYQTALWPEEIAVLGAPDASPVRRRFARLKPTPAHARYVQLRKELESYRKSLPTVMVMREATRPKPTFIRNRGVYSDLGHRVSRDVPARLPPLTADFPPNRLGLAKWLTSPTHPLTARVAVNRYWQKYFGVGLVKTTEDFGVQGDPPSHPELLDWLATEFIRTDWDVAGMQKLIVTSRTYRQRAHATAELLQRDPENRLLARGPRFRLSGHAIRDQALFVAGLLEERIGGPSVSPYQPADLWAEMSMGIKYQQSSGKDLYRRSIYTIWKRTVNPPTMSLFDAADREACWVRRNVTNTPLQALALLNETGYVESARHLGARMLREGGDDPIGFGFQLATARLPSPAERNLLAGALDVYRREFSAEPDAAEALIRVGESPVCNQFAEPELASFTALANVLLNLDEVVSRE